MKHAQVTDLKNTARVAEMVEDADVLVTRNGQTVAYLVNPDHYERLVNNWYETRQAVTSGFLQ
ncbi:hypothetical protein VB714_13720, partial [Spirulina sp. 06S082]